MRRSPADESQIRDLRELTGFSLPRDYLEFLKVSNGGAGPLCIEPWAFSIWSAEEVIRKNLEYRLNEWTPNCFACGTNRGDDFLMFRKTDDTGAVYIIPMFVTSECDALLVAYDFEMFAMACGVEPV